VAEAAEILVKVLHRGDDRVLAQVAPGVFDFAVDMKLVGEFLGDKRHHIVVAVDGGIVVGFASGVHYVHPDKAAELWVNEVAVAPTHRGRGLGKRILQTIFEVARERGCGQAWVLTDRDNEAAMGLYQSVGGVAAPKEALMFEFRLGKD
jgi:ribosomal protein S18 acetylase RimI-like enzyme